MRSTLLIVEPNDMDLAEKLVARLTCRIPEHMLAFTADAHEGWGTRGARFKTTIFLRTSYEDATTKHLDLSLLPHNNAGAVFVGFKYDSPDSFGALRVVRVRRCEATGDIFAVQGESCLVRL